MLEVEVASSNKPGPEIVWWDVESGTDDSLIQMGSEESEDILIWFVDLSWSMRTNRLDSSLEEGIDAVDICNA